MKRREFIGKASMLLAAGVVLPGCLQSVKKGKKIGINTYTLHDMMNEEPQKTLELIARVGYKWIEVAGYTEGKLYGIEITKFGNLIRDLGMELISSHCGLYPETADMIADDAAKAGLKYVVLPNISRDRRNTADDFYRIADDLNKSGEIVKKRGLKAGYHNHPFEFTRFGDTTGYDILLNNTDPELVTFQPDLFWIVAAGHNPVDYFEKYPGRFEMFHVKDMEKEPGKQSTPIGSGRIDFEPMFAKASVAGMKYFFIEQEEFNDNTIEESIELSFQFLNKARFTG
jgi:sugar phosphate isomerase/epimerase